MKILIGADIVPTESNMELFLSGDAQRLAGTDLLRVLSSADHRIFNLEAPLTDDDAPIEKCGPNLRAPTGAVNGLAALGVSLVTLANNHILDHGAAGLSSTQRALSGANIAYAGAGETLGQARKPYIFEAGGKRIGVYACAEHEFSIASERSAGANPFDPLDTPDDIARLKGSCEHVIVLYHGGKEHYRYPSPGLQKICRRLVEKGADLVVCQHSHCIGCEEKYLGGTIVYGQGNFLFDGSGDEKWQTGLLVCVEDDFNISYIPVVRQNETVRLADERKAADILSGFRGRSAEIQQSGAVERRYREFSEEMISGYLQTFSAHSRNILFRAVNRLSGYRFGRWYAGRKYGINERLALWNVISCEAHRELLLEGLKKEWHER